MKPVILVQDRGPNFGDSDSINQIKNELIPFVEEMGFRVIRAIYVPFSCDIKKVELTDSWPTEDEFVIPFGTIQFIQMLQSSKKDPRVNKNIWCDWDKLKCSWYYPRLTNFLVNEDYILVPLGNLVQQTQVDLIYAHLSNANGSVFIRPDDNNKLFTGQVVNKELVRDFYTSVIGPNNGYDFESVGHKMVVVSRPSPSVRTGKEYRLVVRHKNGHIPMLVTASEYLPEQKRIGFDTHQQLFQTLDTFVHSVDYRLNNFGVFSPSTDYLYTIDVAVTKDDIRVLEIGSINCCGFYDCDIKAILSSLKDIYNGDSDVDNKCI